MDLKVTDKQLDRAAAALTAFGLIAATGLIALVVLRRLRDDDEVRQRPVDAWRGSLSASGEREQLP